MKRTLSFILASAMLATMASCSKQTADQPEAGNTNNENVEPGLVKVTFNGQFSDITKSALTADGKVQWVEGDAISIFDGAGNNVKAEAQDISEDGTKATFEAELVPAEIYYAVYPYNEANSFSEAVITAAGITSADNNGTFQSAHASAACASAAEPDMLFANILSLIKFESTRTDVDYVTIEGANGEPLSGLGCITFGGVKPEFNLTEGGCAVVNVNKTSGIYYAAVNPVALTNGFVIKYYAGTVDSDGYLGSVTGTKPLAIAAGKIVNLGDIDSHYAIEGRGTEAEPYILRSVRDFDIMRGIKENQELETTTYWEMGHDIDLDGIEWTPIDTRNEKRCINFDGKGHKISNLSMSGNTKYMSFFGLICGTVQNIEFENCNLTTNSSNQCGILSGWICNNAGSLGPCFVSGITCRNCTVSKTAAGSKDTGLAILCGGAGNTTFTNCHAINCKVDQKSNSGNVDANKESWTAGLVGGSYGCTYKNCSFTGESAYVTSVYNNRNVGGLVGKAINLTDRTHVFEGCRVEAPVSSKADLCGGLVAWVATCEIKDCHVKGNVTIGAAGLSTATDAYSYAGGVVGYITTGVSMTMTGCSYEGTVISSGKVCGGLLGQNSSNTTISDCSVKGTITGGQFVGGVSGYTSAGNYKVQNTVVNANVESKSSILGGILGQSQAGTVTITGCAHSGTLKLPATGNQVGGIVGNTNTATKATIEKCSHTGDIIGNNCIGGIVGQICANGKTQTCIIRNCYTAGGTVTGNQAPAGIASDCGNNTTTIENCYCSMTVMGAYGNGSIVGRFCNLENPNSKGTWNTGNGYILKNCIAWSPAMGNTKGGSAPSTGYSSGAVVGCTVNLSTIQNCWRRPDINFSCYPSTHAAYNTLVDMDDTDPDHPYVQMGNKETYYRPHHGKAAAAGETLSQVAQRIGWDAAIWDFSADAPTLRK